jgi:hypothetical protein
LASLAHDLYSHPLHRNEDIPRIDDVMDDRLHRAILYTVAYSDIFEYPLTEHEIHRYLTGVRVSSKLVSEALNGSELSPRYLSNVAGYYTLPGRESIVELRRTRAKVSAKLWPLARFYGGIIARIPFVRMVAVTGELSVNSVRDRSDIDFFIVTEPGRLWLTRAMVILIVKAGEFRGITVCPNYLVTENALGIVDQNLYTAREMVQMVPLAGFSVYERLRDRNSWVKDFLPNATGSDSAWAGSRSSGRPRRLAEALLRTRVVERIEQWEMNRKIEKLTRQNGKTDEVAFSADWCKGHFDGHGHRTLQAFAERVQMVEGLMQ